MKLRLTPHNAIGDSNLVFHSEWDNLNKITTNLTDSNVVNSAAGIVLQEVKHRLQPPISCTLPEYERETKNEKAFIIVGDPMKKHVNGRDISGSHTVKVRPNHDLIDYLKSSMRKMPKALVIHTGTNDIQQEINSMTMVRKLVKVIKEIDSEKETEIIFSGLIQREDHDFHDQIEEINSKLKRCCDSKGYRFVENSNIDRGFLNRSKIHLNKKGTALLSSNIANVPKYI